MNAYYAEMSEWFKEHDWKSCVGLKPTGGSNPLLCAKKRHPLGVSFLRRTSLQKLRIIGGSCEEKSVHASSLLRLSPFRRRFVAQQQYALLCVLRAQNELAETPNFLLL